MFRRSDKGPEADGTTALAPDPADPTDLDDLDDLGAPIVWNFKSATAWCRRHNWHLDGIGGGKAVWDAGAAYTARLYVTITPDMQVSTPATFDRAAQTGECSLFIFNLKNQQVYSVQMSGQ
jgi:hypothetical protein